MLLDQYVDLKWNPKIKNRYIQLGYEYTKMGDTFKVKVLDLLDKSSAIVRVKCDYCGREYTKHWLNYILENNRSNIHKDCCINCRKHKISESNFQRYGVKSVLSIDSVKEKVRQTNIEKYGSENPFSVEFIKDKIKSTNIERYGVVRPLQNKAILKSVSNTCQQKYGVPYYICTQRFYGEDNPRWKGGVENHRCERASHEYINWRTQVFSRDHYTCACCGVKSGNGHTVKLNAHHILNWKDYPEYRYEIFNGVTLCDKCHHAFHSKYGKRNNNRTQLNEFICNYGKKVC